MKLLNGFSKLKIAVLGDYFLDKAIYIDRSLDELSLETGIIAYQAISKRSTLGAAGNVINNLKALSVYELYAIGFIGLDGEGWELKKCLTEIEVDTRWLIQDSKLYTPTYVKPIFVNAEVYSESNRIDIRKREKLEVELEEKVIENIKNAAKLVDAIIVVDQIVERNTGTITDRIRKELEVLADKNPELLLLVDSRAFCTEYHNVIVKCNNLELFHNFKLERDSDSSILKIKQYAKKLSQKTTKSTFVTCGELGICIANEEEVSFAPAVKVEGEIDVCGAGDTASAALTCALCSGADINEAAEIANLAASITIEEIGKTGTATCDQILSRYREAK